MDDRCLIFAIRDDRRNCGAVMDDRCLILAIKDDRDAAGFIEISVAHTRVEAQRRKWRGRRAAVPDRRPPRRLDQRRSARKSRKRRVQAGLRACELRSAVMDDRFLISAIMEDRKNRFIDPFAFPRDTSRSGQ